jgi:hypothetical protein
VHKIPDFRAKSRYHVVMSMRRTAIALTFLTASGLAASAGADTFGGFSGVDRPYLVNQDRVCKPIAVANSAASGAASCEKAPADVIARLSIKPPIVQSGAKATFAAQASGRTITISRKTGGTVVTWTAPDPIGKIVELYASQYDDRVAVAFTVRRAGREVTDVIAFDLGQGRSTASTTGATGVRGSPTTVIAPILPNAPNTSTDPTAQPPDPAADPSKPPADAAPEDPRLTKAVADARAASKTKATAAWKAVLAIETTHAEALFRSAAAELAARRPAEAIAALQALASSPRPDAVEWLVEARFAPAFAAVRSDPKFRAAVGLDRKPETTYERLMGFGGQWEQTGTSCDKPEVRFVATRDRNFKLRVKTTCEGSIHDTSFKGTWRVVGNRVVLQLPNQGKQLSAADEAVCGFEVVADEEGLRCSLGHDTEFVVLPTRR